MRRNYRKHTNPNPLQRWLLRRFHTAVADLIAAVVSPIPPSRILDVGCGEGFVADFLRQREFKVPVVGLDADRLALRGFSSSLAGSALSRGLIEGSATALPFVDGAFPVVLCLEVLEHIPKPELALRELDRVSSGYVIVSVPNQPFFSAANFLRGKNLRTLGEDPEHVHHWLARQFLRTLSGTLHVQEVRYAFPWVIALCRKA